MDNETELDEQEINARLWQMKLLSEARKFFRYQLHEDAAAADIEGLAGELVREANKMLVAFHHSAGVPFRRNNS